MDLRQYLLQRKSWIAACAALAVLAGVATAVVLTLTLDQTFRARVDFPVPDDRASSSGNVGLFVADVQQAVFGGEVRRAVRDEIGTAEIPPLSVLRLGQSTTVRIETEGTDPRVLTTALDVAARESVAAVEGGPSDRDARLVEILRLRAEEAAVRLDDIRAQAGTLFPDADYRSLDAQIRRLQIDRQQAAERGATFTVRQIDADLAPIIAQRDALQPFVLSYQQAADEADSTRGAFLDESSDLAVRDALAESAPAAPEPDLLVEEEPQLPTILSTSVLAALVTLALGLALVGLSDLLRGRRDPSADEAAAAEGDQQVDDRGASASAVEPASGRSPSGPAPVHQEGVVPSTPSRSAGSSVRS